MSVLSSAQRHGVLKLDTWAWLQLPASEHTGQQPCWLQAQAACQPCRSPELTALRPAPADGLPPDGKTADKPLPHPTISNFVFESLLMKAQRVNLLSNNLLSLLKYVRNFR